MDPLVFIRALPPKRSAEAAHKYPGSHGNGQMLRNFLPEIRQLYDSLPLEYHAARDYLTQRSNIAKNCRIPVIHLGKPRNVT